jgi:hypothetical protein
VKEKDIRKIFLDVRELYGIKNVPQRKRDPKATKKVPGQNCQG